MAWPENLDWSVFYSIPNGLRDCRLAKLGLEMEQPTKDYPDRLVRAHLCKIPFENLASPPLERTCPCSGNPLRYNSQFRWETALLRCGLWWPNSAWKRRMGNRAHSDC